MDDFGESGSKGSGVSDFMDHDEYVLYGRWKGEDGGEFRKDEMVISGTFHKGLPYGSVFSEVREDVDVKKPIKDLCWASSFLSFLNVFSISGSNVSGVHVCEDLGIKQLVFVVPPKTTLICKDGVVSA